MNTIQVQLKISLSDQLNDLLQSKAARLGLPVTQFVKHLIIKEVESDTYPVFTASERTDRRAKEAMDQADQAVDAEAFFNKLDNES